MLNTTFSSSAPAGAIEPISERFELSEIMGTLMISLFVMGYTFGPLLWGPVCPRYRHNQHISLTGIAAFRGIRSTSGFPSPIHFLHLNASRECISPQHCCPPHLSLPGRFLRGCSTDQRWVRFPTFLNLISTEGLCTAPCLVTYGALAIEGKLCLSLPLDRSLDPP